MIEFEKQNLFDIYMSEQLANYNAMSKKNITQEFLDWFGENPKGLSKNEITCSLLEDEDQYKSEYSIDELLECLIPLLTQRNTNSSNLLLESINNNISNGGHYEDNY